MRISMMWVIARAEMRSIRRLTRYWVFSILATLFAFAGYMQYAVIHAMASNLSATIGAVGPRYLVSALGLYMLIVFLIGLVFLAFDVRARDVRERMAEVLDVRPISNLEFVFGRGIGLVLMAMAPVLVMGLIVQTFGTLAIVFEWPIGEPVEPFSLFGLFFDAFAIFLIWSAVIVFLAVVVSNRLIVALLALTLIGLQMWSVLQTPVYMQSALGFISAILPASDVLSAFNTTERLIQRMGLWALGIGLFSLAAAVHPRLDTNRKPETLAGVSFVALGVVIIGSLLWVAKAGLNQHDAWLAVHESRSGEPRLDLQAISGSVAIDPGNSLGLVLALRVKAPSNEPVASLLFTLNPGLAVGRVLVDGDLAEWTFDDGLLEIQSSLQPDGVARIELTASGVPNKAFGYLDSAINFLTGNTLEAQIAILGVDVSVFDRRYVALTPGSYWLPQAGTAVPTADARTHPPDYFTLDLEVGIPADWTVAGPGSRELVSATTYRFRPDAPLPMVGLFAAEFERRAVTVAGVDFELLTHPSHRRNLEFFADIGDELESYLEELLSADRYGLVYPYGSISLVEVPGSLRGYGGGWRMDSVQTMPGVVTMRESSFPTARFERAFEDEEDYEAQEGGLPRAKVEAIKTFFENDVSGGNIFLGAARNYFLYQTSASGEGALALNFMLDELVTQLITGSSNFFSPFLFEQAGSSVVGETVTNMLSGQAESVMEAVRNSSTNRASVWDMALGTALVDLEPDLDPQTALNVLALKCGAIVNSILRGVEREKIGAMLALLLERYRGRTFTAEQFTQAATEAGVDLQPLIGDWLTDVALPGFLTSSVVVSRLQDDERGVPRYQTRFHLRNDEPTPGLVYFSYKIGGGQRSRQERLKPIRVPGDATVEVGLLSDMPITELTMHPFLSLNRSPVRLPLPRFDTTQRLNDAPFLGSRPSDWVPARGDAIYVDDLDDGFSITGTAPPPKATPAGMFSSPVDLDQGLPEYKAMFDMPAVWSRQQNPTSWGKYRHTAAFIRAGQGSERASFSTAIPASGRWRLALHVPNVAGQEISASAGGGGLRAEIRAASGVVLGSYDISLLNNGDTEAIEFDAEAAETGWNTLGVFELSAGEAEVRLTDTTSGEAVVADAIRWEPL